MPKLSTRLRGLSTALCMVAAGCGNDSNADFGKADGAGGASGAGGFAGTGGASGAAGTPSTSSGGVVGSGGASSGGVVGVSGGSSGGAVGTGGLSGPGGTSGGGAGGSFAGASGTGGGAGGAGGAGSSGMGAGGKASGGAGGKASGGAGGKASGGTGGSAGDASAPDGSDGSGVPPSVERLFPLAVGNVWNYLTTILPGSTGTSPCAAGMHATTITGRAMFMGENGFTATHVCAPMTTRYYVENQSGLEVNVGTTWSVVLPRPIADGAVFLAASSSEVLGRVANITVPAGTFPDCWQTAYVSATGPVTTYCAGVGLVSLEYDAPNGGGYKIELVSYTLN